MRTLSKIVFKGLPHLKFYRSRSKLQTVDFRCGMCIFSKSCRWSPDAVLGSGVCLQGYRASCAVGRTVSRKVIMSLTLLFMNEGRAVIISNAYAPFFDSDSKGYQDRTLQRVSEPRETLRIFCRSRCLWPWRETWLMVLPADLLSSSARQNIGFSYRRP